MPDWSIVSFLCSDGLSLQGLAGKGVLLLVVVLLARLFPLLRRIRVSLDQVHGAAEEKRSRFKRSLIVRMQTSEHINHALDQLLHSLGCDRAYVFQYHNGGENVAGVPFAKCSVTHERVRGITDSRILDWQNLPISLFASITKALSQGREFFCVQTGGISDCDLGGTMIRKGFGTKSLYVIGIFSFDDVPVGFVGIDYCHFTRELSKGEHSNLKASAFKICGLLLSERGE